LKSQSLQANRVYRAVPVQAEAAHSCVTLDAPATGERIALRDTALAVWDRLQYPATIEGISDALAAEYEAPLEEIRGAVRSVVEGLVECGVVAPCEPARSDPVRDRYLALLKRALANTLYPELELQVRHLEQGGSGLSGPELQRFLRDIAHRLPDDLAMLLDGKRQGTWDLRFPHTMIGLFRLGNIERCAEQVIAQGVLGDFLEAGVCKGGAAIFMRALQIAHGAADRKTWVVDSFAGVPPSDRQCDSRYGLDLEEQRVPWLACSEAAVRDHFARYDLLDAQVEFVAGRLSESLPAADIGALALLRIDVDLYSSTFECLDLLYDKVSPGGFVIVDDYGLLACCRDAVDEFRAQRGIEDPIQWIDPSGIYWRKASVPGEAS
jgi:hypothetical protein